MFRTRFVSIFRSNTQNWTNTQHYPHGHPNHIVPRFNVHIPLAIGPLHPTRIDTHWWLPLQFCVLLLKMDTNRASETCRVIINQVKQKLHLVGYLLIRYFKDARYHEHKKMLTKCYLILEILFSSR